jgi:hypothetical protein
LLTVVIRHQGLPRIHAFRIRTLAVFKRFGNGHLRTRNSQMVENTPNVIGAAVQPAYRIQPAQGDIVVDKAACSLHQGRLPVGMAFIAEAFSQSIGFVNRIVARRAGCHCLREVMQLPRQVAQARFATQGFEPVALAAAPHQPFQMIECVHGGKVALMGDRLRYAGMRIAYEGKRDASGILDRFDCGINRSGWLLQQDKAGDR